jgi:hypothetical protein
MRKGEGDQLIGVAVKGDGSTACHVGPTFTDERFHNTGVAWREARRCPWWRISAGQGQLVPHTAARTESAC